jgi:hypothetical protein
MAGCSNHSETPNNWMRVVQPLNLVPYCDILSWLAHHVWKELKKPSTGAASALRHYEKTKAFQAA